MMPRPFRCLFTALVLGSLLCDTLYGQMDSRPGGREVLTIKNLSHICKWWTSDDGLPSDRIDVVCETPDGRIWVATGNKLGRLSNGRFQSIYLERELQAGVGSVIGMEADRGDGLWVFTDQREIIRYAEGAFQFYQTEDSPGFGLVQALVADVGGAGLMAFMGDGGQSKQYRLRADGWELLAELPASVGAVVSAAYDADGGLWIVSEDRVLYAVKDGVPQPVQAKSLPGWQQGSFSKLFTTPDGQLAACGQDACYLLRGQAVRLERRFSANPNARKQPDECYMDREGKVWMRVFGQGLHVADSSGRVHVIDTRDIHLDPPTFFLYQDQSGIFWIGSHSGLFQIGYSPFVSFTLSSKKSGLTPFESIQQDADDRLWFLGQGLLGFMEEDFMDIELAAPIPHGGGKVMSADAGGILLANSEGELMLYGLDTGFEASGDRLRVAQRQLDSSGGQRGGSQGGYGPPDSRGGPREGYGPGGSQRGYGPPDSRGGPPEGQWPPHFRGGPREGYGPGGSQGGYGPPDSRGGPPEGQWPPHLRGRPREGYGPGGSQGGYGPPDSRGGPPEGQWPPHFRGGAPEDYGPGGSQSRGFGGRGGSASMPQVINGMTPTALPRLPVEGRLRLYAAFATLDGEHWIASDQGLFHQSLPLSEDRPYERVRLPEPAGLAGVSALLEEPGGALYAAVIGHGIYLRAGPGAEWFRLANSPEAGGARLTALQMDTAGRLWALAESSEIFCLSRDQPARSLRPKNFGLGDSPANGMVADQTGGLWLSTDTEGVAYASSAHLQAVLEERQSEPGLVWFDRDSGLSTTSCSGKPSGLFRSRDGRIWVANSRGVSVIDPSIWRAHLDRFPDAPVSIDVGILDGIPSVIEQDEGESLLRVGHRTRKIEIRFGSTHHTFLGRPRYRYRLLGFASEWVDTQGQNFTVYQNLPPGQYTFEVNAGLPDGRWSAHRSSLRLEVDAHWTEHSAFRAAMVLALFAALAALFGLRVRHLKQRSRRQEAFTRKLLESQEEERKRIAGELHDSLGQDLILIKNSSELAKRKVGSDAVSMSSLEDISGIATHAINEARAITANLRPLELDRVGLRSAVQTMLDRIAEHSEIAVDADLSALEAGWPPPDDISLYRVLQEVLNNAMKHSAAQNLCIQTSTTDSWLVLLIRDDGVGFNLEKLRQRSARTGLGLESLQERIQLLEGKLTLESAPGKGTVIRIVLPLPKGRKVEG